MRRNNLNFVLISIIVAVFAMAASCVMSRYAAYLVHVVAIAAIGALSLNLLLGWCGQISFAQGALLGIGAYTAGVAINNGWGVASILVAGVVAATVGVLIGLPALRLRGLYFAIASLAAQVIIEWLFKLLEPVTHGMSGLSIGSMVVFGRVIESDQDYAVLAIGALLITWLSMYWIRTSDLGRAFLVIRHSELVARGMGIDVARTKLIAFAISGLFAGIAGALMGLTARLAHPEAFGMNLSIDHVAMIIVGGLTSLSGPLFGAAFVTLLPEVIQRLGEAFGSPSILFALRDMVFGLLIIAFLMFAPGGISSALNQSKIKKLFRRADK